LLFAIRYSYPVPYWDESGYIHFVTGSQPVTLHWLWSQANEHRIPLIRMIYLFEARAFSLDQRLMNAANIGMLIATSGIIMLALRRLNGRTQYTDVIVPLTLLNLGHWANTTWPNQLGFIVPTCLLSLCAAGFALRGRGEERRYGLIAAAVLGMLLCGANGLPVGLALLPMLVWGGIAARTAGRIRQAWFSFGCALVALAYTAFYFVGLVPAIPVPPRPFVFSQGLTEGLKVCSQAIGPFSRVLWPYSGIAVLLLFALCLGLLLRANREERFSAAGLGLALAGIIGLGFGVGMGRTILGPGAGFAVRYALLMAPFLIIAVMIVDRFASPSFRTFVRMSLLLSLSVLYWPNSQQEIGDLAGRAADGKRLEAAVQQGVPIGKLAEEFGPRWMFNADIFAANMRDLEAHRMGVYWQR